MIDFYKKLNKEQIANIEKRKKSLQRRTVNIIDVFDTEGNKFTKTITISKCYNILSFGGFCEYHLNDLINHISGYIARSEFKRLSIDVMGHNHLGYEVSIPADKMLKLMYKAIKLRKKLTKEDKDNGK